MNIKKTLTYVSLFTLLLMISIPSRSQVLISILLGDKLNSGGIEFGLTGGYNRTYMYQISEAKGLNNFNLGFYFDIRLKKETNWYLYTGCLVKSNMGASNIDVYTLNDPETPDPQLANLDSIMYDGYINRFAQYFNVPITVKYRFKNNIFVLAGTQLGLRYRARDEFTDEIFDKDDLVFKYKTEDNYRRIDAGMTLGAGYKFRYGTMMNIGVRYYLGITNIYKDEFKTRYGDVTNSALYIFAEIPIGADRKKRPAGENKK